MFAEYYAHMGDDDMVADAARVSFSKQAEHFTAEQNEKLIKYLAEHKHWTPFAHPQITLRVSAPVPIRTQCFKSKVGFVENEESRRYISDAPRLFIPEQFRSKAVTAKQGSAGAHPKSIRWRNRYIEVCQEALHTYNEMIRDGVAPEQARFVLPQGVEVEWFWTGSLAAYARFYKLRTDPHAQEEVNTLAEMVGSIVSMLFPTSWKYLTTE